MPNTTAKTGMLDTYWVSRPFYSSAMHTKNKLSVLSDRGVARFRCGQHYYEVGEIHAKFSVL